MPYLRHSDVRAVLDTVRELAELDDPDQLVAKTLEHLLRLLPGEVVGYNRVDLGKRQAQVVLHPALPRFTAPTARLSETMDDHPMLRRWARPGADLRPCRMSDVVSEDAWRRTRTYAEVLGPMGTPRMLAIPLRFGPHGGEGYAVTRSGRDFCARDRDVAQALQPALVALHRRSRRRAAVGSSPPLPAAPPMTPRELDVLCLLSEGWSAQSISRRLGIRPATVRKHLEHVYAKLGTSDRLTAVNRARSLGLL